MSDITQILERIEKGDQAVADELLETVYGELQKLAQARLNRENGKQSIQATELVHEAYLRLVQSSAISWQSRGHFFSAAAEAMRRILIERARRRKSLKQGGGRNRIDLEERFLSNLADPDRLLLIDEALEELIEEDPQAANVVKLRAFAGLSMEQVAQVLGIANSTAYRHWTYARARLISKLAS